MNLRYHFLPLPVLALLLCGCDSWTYRAVPNVSLSYPNELGSEGPVVFQSSQPGLPPMTASIQQSILDHANAAPVNQTVLMATWKHDYGTYESSVRQTLVVRLDGDLKPGQYWISPENAVLITYSAYSAPSRQRIGLAGSIKVLQVNDNKIIADVAVRDTREIDSSDFLDQPWDPQYAIFPFSLTGTHTFAITSPTDPLFEKAGVKWVAQ